VVVVVVVVVAVMDNHGDMGEGRPPGPEWQRRAAPGRQGLGRGAAGRQGLGRAGGRADRGMALPPHHLVLGLPRQLHKPLP